MTLKNALNTAIEANAAALEIITFVFRITGPTPYAQSALDKLNASTKSLHQALNAIERSSKSPFQCTVHDACEGSIHLVVWGKDEQEAYDEAEIAAAEQGCRNVKEIVVGVFE